MDSIMNMKDPILVTGGAGYTPVTCDNLVYGHRSAVKWGPLEGGDFSDRQRLEMVIRKYNPTAVMHFAAYTYVGESVAPITRGFLGGI